MISLTFYDELAYMTWKAHNPGEIIFKCYRESQKSFLRLRLRVRVKYVDLSYFDRNHNSVPDDLKRVTSKLKSHELFGSYRY